MIFFWIYIIIGSACVAQHALDIAEWEAFNPSSTWRVFWAYVLTWPWWVFKQ